MPSNMNRKGCIYRCSRILWLKDVIELANNNDVNIQTWVTPQYRKQNGKSKRKFIRYIRFQHNTVDYVILLEEQRRNQQIKQYWFISAYPVTKRELKRTLSLGFGESFKK